jgi:Tol biopolymer transport system component
VGSRGAFTATRALVASALVVGAGLLVAACGGEGEPRPDLLLVSTRDGDYAIYAMNADGGRQARLTAGGQSNPSSPQELFFQIDPAWSPNGRLIAFSSKRSGSFDIFVMNADGTGTRRLTSTRDDEANPTWSPDGKRLGFDRGRDIYAVNANGTDLLRITDDSAADTEAAWSPDGSWIAYVKGAAETVGKDLREVWLTRPDGTGSHSLTTLRASSYSPAWSPDSSRIAFASDRGKGGIFDIYTVGVDGKDLRRLTRTGPDAFEPAWSPDGKTIAFSRGGAIVSIDPEGNEEELTDPDNNDSSPVWNPRPPSATG